MRVIAKEEGFYGGTLIPAMTEFEFNGKKLGKWMTPVDGEEVKKEDKVEDKGPTATEIKAQLSAAGVEFRGNASRESLFALLQETIQKACPGAFTAATNIGEKTEDIV